MRLGGIRKYLGVAANLFKVMLSYRTAFVLMGIGNIIYTLAVYYFWRAAYANVPEIGGMTFAAMTTYVIVAQVVSGMVGMFFVEGSIATAIREGTIAVELAAPMDFQVKKLFESLGLVGLKGLITGSIIVATGVFFLGISGPASPLAAAAFVVSVALAIVIECSLGFMTGLVAFYTTNIFGMVMTRKMLSDFFSGAVAPLAFFPPPLRAVAALLPFQAAVHVPVSIYLGVISGSAIVTNLGLQVFWALTCWLAGRWAWIKVVRRLEVHGG